MNISKITNKYISVDEKFFMLSHEGVKGNNIRVYDIKGQDDVCFDRAHNSINYVRLKPNAEFNFKSGSLIPSHEIATISYSVNIFETPLSELPKGIRERVNMEEYIWTARAYSRWDNFIDALGYVCGQTYDEIVDIDFGVNLILLSYDKKIIKKFIYRLLVVNRGIIYMIAKNEIFRKYLLFHPRDYFFLKKHYDDFPLQFSDLIKALFTK